MSLNVLIISLSSWFCSSIRLFMFFIMSLIAIIVASIVPTTKIIISILLSIKCPPFFFDYMQLEKGSQERSLYDYRF